MAWWGIAYAAGPFYNRPWLRYSEREIAETLPLCHRAAVEARRAFERAGNARPGERALIEAVSARYRSRNEFGPSHVLDRWHQRRTPTKCGRSMPLSRTTWI